MRALRVWVWGGGVGARGRSAPPLTARRPGVPVLREQVGREDMQDSPSERAAGAHDSQRPQGGADPLDTSGELSARGEEAQRQLEGMGAEGSELDKFIRLRSYVLHMQEGASLLLWKEDGLELCWFRLDKECLSLNWEVDETSTTPRPLADDSDADEDPAARDAQGKGGGSLLLERIVDIVPLGAGADQLTNSPTDSSFTVLLQDSRLDIVAPTSLDFQVPLVLGGFAVDGWFWACFVVFAAFSHYLVQSANTTHT